MTMTEGQNIRRDEFAPMLRQAGLRVTQQRLSILAELCAASDHPTAEELFARTRKIDGTVAVATVYRTLSALAAAGLVTRLDLGGGSSRFELAPGKQHDHFIDVDTGEIIEVHSEELDSLRHRVAAARGYDIVEQQTVWRVKRRS